MALSAARSPVAGLRVVLDWLADRLEDSGYRYGCPLATTTLEIASESDVVQQACRDAYAAWREVIADRLVADGLKRSRADDAATLVLSAMEGALILARAERTVRPIRVLAKHLPLIVGAST